MQAAAVQERITFVSDFAYLLAMLKSSSLLATVGLSFTIPLAVAGDLIRGGHSDGAQADLGSVIILVMFEPQWEITVGYNFQK